MVTVRKKTTLIMLIIAVVLILFVYFLSNRFLLQSYRQLEEKHVAEHVKRVWSSLEDEFAYLDTIAGDWALWDDTLAFIQDQNPEYIESNLPDSTLANLKLNFMIFLDSSGKVVYSKGFDLGKNSGMPVPKSLVDQLRTEGPILSVADVNRSNTGLLFLPEGVLLVASRPITTSDGKGPVGGNLVLGKYLDSGEISNLSGITHLPLSLVPLEEEKGGKRVDSEKGIPIFVRPENNQVITAWIPLTDIYGKPRAALQVRMNRELYQKGKTTILYLFFALALITLCVIFLALVLLERLVLSRLVKLGADVGRISVNGDLSDRVAVQGHDELPVLGGKINEMLDKLQESQLELRKNEEKFRSVYAQLPIGLVMYDPAGRVVEMNRAYLDIFGIAKPEDIIGRRLTDDPNITDDLRTRLFSPDVVRFEMEYDFEAVKRGGFYPTERSGKCHLDWMINPLVMKTFFFDGFVGQIQNITQRKEAEVQLKYLSMHDPLTGLYNRARFENEMNRFEDDEYGPASIIVCDVDGLKLVNDTLGHDAGDVLLKATAQVLKDSFRKEDIVARIGGDEFVVLLPGADINQAEKACDRIMAAVDVYNRNLSSAIPLSLSVGLASGVNSPVKIDELMKEADNNMYREKLYHRQSTRSDLVQILSKALKARDIITEEQAQRIQNYAVNLARAAGLQEHTIADLRLLAQFHDIGKVGVPDSVLLKKGKLTIEEFLAMQRHCEIGYRIARSSQDLLPIADWILRHHERWDGKGYPLGLQGESIPLACRILALADAYDAMVNRRPYGNPLTYQEAVAELKKGAGSQFDPRLVTLFLQILEEKKGKNNP